MNDRWREIHRKKHAVKRLSTKNNNKTNIEPFYQHSHWLCVCVCFYVDWICMQWSLNCEQYILVFRKDSPSPLFVSYAFLLISIQNCAITCNSNKCWLCISKMRRTLKSWSFEKITHDIILYHGRNVIVIIEVP